VDYELLRRVVRQRKRRVEAGVPGHISEC
jgi:hypothetical protein